MSWNRWSASLVFSLALFSTLAIEAREKKTSFSDAIERSFTEAMVKPPLDNEVCFSPDEHCDLKLLKFVNTAQKTLDVAVYDINLDALGHALLAKEKQGVKVRLIVDHRQAKERNSIVPMLLKAGANLKYGHQRGIMHNKFVIVDGQRMETGSFNYTHHASVANNENQIYLSTPSIVVRYNKRFEEMWTAAGVTVREPSAE